MRLPKSALAYQENTGESVLLDASAQTSVLIFLVHYMQLLRTFSCLHSFVKRYTLKHTNPGFANRTKQRNLFIMKNWGSWAAQSEEKQGLQCIGYGVSDVSGLFPRCIFPLWRCSQTAATNGPVNLHGARQSSGCMRSATSWGGGRWIFHHILFLCICLHFVDVPFKESYFLSCAQLIIVHKQSFEKTHMNHLCQQ